MTPQHHTPYFQLPDAACMLPAVPLDTNQEDAIMPTFELVTHDGEVSRGEVVKATTEALWLRTPRGDEAFEWDEVRELRSIEDAA